MRPPTSLPSLVVARLWETTLGARAGWLGAHAAASLGAALIGFVLGALVGFGVGLGLSQSRTARRLLKPFIDGFSAVPPAFGPLPAIPAAPSQLHRNFAMEPRLMHSPSQCPNAPRSSR
jgi:ABC-type nitrate/sulfonate/bicarbonate transport system permease component